MSSQNEDVWQLKNEIIKCQEETLQLFRERQRWPEKSNLLERTKEIAVADLRKQRSSKSIQAAELEDLNSALKDEEDYESQLKRDIRELEVEDDEYKESMDTRLMEVEELRDNRKKDLIDFESRYNSLYKRRLEMEKKLEHFNVFCEAVYSTLESKECSGVSFVKEAKKMKEGLDSKKSQ